MLQQHSLALSTLPGLVANCGESTNNVGDVYRINSIGAKAQLDIFIKTKYEHRFGKCTTNRGFTRYLIESGYRDVALQFFGLPHSLRYVRQVTFYKLQVL